MGDASGKPRSLLGLMDKKHREKFGITLSDRIWNEQMQLLKYYNQIKSK